MIWLFGSALALLILLLLLLVLPIEWRQRFFLWLRGLAEGPRRRRRPAQPSRSPSSSRSWQEEQPADPETKRQRWQAHSRQVLERMQVVKNGLQGSKTQPLSTSTNPPQLSAKIEPKQQSTPDILVRLLIGTVLIVGIPLLVVILRERWITPKRPHRLTILLAPLSMSDNMAPSLRARQSSQELLSLVEQSLQEQGLADLVRLELSADAPLRPALALDFARNNDADLLLWGWLQQQSPPRYNLHLTINPRLDREVPEFEQYLQLMMTPPTFSLYGGGSTEGVSPQEVAQTVTWLAHFYLGQFERIEDQKPPDEATTGPSSEVLQFHWAALQWLGGDYAQAQQTYDRLLTERYGPNCPQESDDPICLGVAHNKAVTILTRESLGALAPTSLDEAIQLLRAIVDSATPDKEPALDLLPARYNLGRAYLARGGSQGTASAVAQLERVTQEDRHHAAAWAALSEAYREQEKIALAKEAALFAVREDDSLALAYVALGRSLLQEQELSRASRELDTALDLAMEESRRRRSRGTALREGPKANPGRARYALAWAKRNDDVLAQVHLAQAELYLALAKEEGRPSIFVYVWRLITQEKAPSELAIDELKQALEKHPQWYPALYLRGEIYLADQEFDHAVNAFRTAKERDSSRLEAYLGLAEALRQQAKSLDDGQPDEAAKKFAEARATYQELIDKEINSARGHFGLGEIAEETGDIELARQEFQKAVDSNPNYAQAYLRLGQVDMKLGDQEKALDNFALAIDKAAGQPETRLKARLERGAIYLEKYLWKKNEGEADNALLNQAQDEWQKAQNAVDRDVPAALSGLGRVAYEKSQFDQALDYLKQAYGLQRNDFNTLYGLGLVYEAQASSSLALDYFFQAQQSDKKNIAALYHLGVAYFAQLNEQQALEHFQQVERMCQERPEKKQRSADEEASCQEIADWLEQLGQPVSTPVPTESAAP
ncbi:MAG: tetratricopeptide repeat protein [Chloroflexia bacterium]|nr:tetratricopeptide repeat protein [Chloroflexia bacterium]